MSEEQNEHVAVSEETTVRPCPGQRLQLARETRGLSIEDVSAELRLHPRQIVALEICQVEQLPGQAFIKGYLRSYCRLLGIEADGLIEEYEQFSLEPPPLVHRALKKQLTSSDTPVRMMTYIIVLLLVGLLAVWWWSQRHDWMAHEPEEAVGQSLSSLPLEPQVVVEPVSPAVMEQGSGAAEANANEETVVAGDESLPEATGQAPEGTSADVVATGDEAAGEPAAANELRLEFTKDCWTEVTDASGKKVFVSLAKAGTTKVIEGQPPYRVFLGFAPGATVYYGGELYDFQPFVRNTVARFTIGKPVAE